MVSDRRLWVNFIVNEQKAARPNIGRPLQGRPEQWRHGFAEASPSGVLREGEGMFWFKVTHDRGAQNLSVLSEVLNLWLRRYFLLELGDAGFSLW